MLCAKAQPVHPAPKACLEIMLRNACVAAFSALLVAACGGGAPTTENPVTSVTPPSTYNGPPPQTADIQNFKLNVWDNIQATNRCGSCHAQGGQGNGFFARNDDINLAYEAANLVADLNMPENSLMVTKLAQGHNCWLTDDQACADIMTTWIEGWAGAAALGGRQITLSAPTPASPGDSRSYANADVSDFVTWVHAPILTTYCAGCHNSQSATSQQPYFAEADANVAFEAAKAKMDINDPAASRFVVRLGSEFHNCWSADCAADAQTMETAIANFAGTIPITQLDPALVNSDALRLIDGTIASGGNRYESAQVALWEFKTGVGTTAFDTSGVDPAIDLQLIGDVQWFGGWGITINDGRAQGDTTSSKKLHDLITATGEYSIEAWVVPNNVTQEMARIVTYSAGDNSRNFTLQQTLYDYNFRHRSVTTGLNGDPALSTPSADEVLQATLQHVVATYGPVEGRKVYVNGNLVTQADPIATGSLVDWQDTFAFVLGNEASGDGLWQGTLRLVAVHNRELTPAQITQNFDVGVGEKFFLLFGIEDIINVPTAYILFEVSQFDSYAYLFAQPHFITLDANQQPQGIPIQGMRIGVNGAEVQISQSYANLDDQLDYTQFGPLGQPLATIGAVIPLERGPSDDEFFLTFDLLGSESYVRTDDPPLVITEGDLPAAERIGVRTFDEINATMSAVTGVSTEEFFVDSTFQMLRQSMPAVEDPAAFLSSHQVAVAQLAIEYCNALIEDQGTISTAAYFPGFDFDETPVNAFDTPAERDALVTPLINNMVGIGITTQPAATDVEDELAYIGPDPGGTERPDNLINRLIAGGTDTRSIAKGTCAAVLGSAALLVQ
ncbi:MAG: LamG domain-containing protein [Woeseiaceae bacterium]|nr:LamG domain-containing protein [Woeseiaceae bacterium]